MNSPLIPVVVLAVLAVVAAFASAKAGQRRIVVCSVVVPAIIQIAVAAWLIATSRGNGSFTGLGVLLLSLFAVPGGLIANVLVHVKWKTLSPWWATARGIIVAALAYAGAALFFRLILIAR